MENESVGITPVLENLSIGNTNIAKVDGDHVSVSAIYTYTPMFVQLPMFGFGPYVSTGFNFQASVIMRAL